MRHWAVAADTSAAASRSQRADNADERPEPRPEPSRERDCGASRQRARADHREPSERAAAVRADKAVPVVLDKQCSEHARKAGKQRAAGTDKDERGEAARREERRESEWEAAEAEAGATAEHCSLAAQTMRMKRTRLG